MSYPQIDSSDFNLARQAMAPWIIERSEKTSMEDKTQPKKIAVTPKKKPSPKPKLSPKKTKETKKGVPKPKIQLKSKK
jgi:hypothetical protein